MTLFTNIEDDFVFQKIIMQKATEDMKKKQAAEAEAKKKLIEQKVGTLSLDGMGKRKIKEC